MTAADHDLSLSALLPPVWAGLSLVSFYPRLAEDGRYPPWQDTPHSVRAPDAEPAVMVRQTHSALLVEHHGCPTQPAPASPANPSPADPASSSLVEADGIISSVPGLRIAVVTADCVPVLLRGDGHVAALHCGWRGIQRRLLDKALSRLAALGEQPERLRLMTGPYIQPAAFEVGPEVIAAFAHRPAPKGANAPEWAAALTLATGKGVSDRWHLDMGLLVAAIALSHGLSPERIAISRECTTREGRWPSYRLSGKGCGRITTAIAL